MFFDKDKLINILVEEEKMADYEANIIIERLEKIDHPQLQKCLEQWMQDRTVSDEFHIDGVTIRMIMEKKKQSFCSALLTIHAFNDSPELLKRILSAPSFIHSVPSFIRKRHPFGR